MHTDIRSSHTATGIVVSTGVAAGGLTANHAEGIVVSTQLSAGGTDLQHAEGIVVPTMLRAATIAACPSACTSPPPTRPTR